MRRCAANQPIQFKTPRQSAAVFFVKEGDFMYKIVFFGTAQQKSHELS